MAATTGTAASAPTRGRGSRGPGSARRRYRPFGTDNLWGNLFLLPWFLGFVGLTVGPMLASLYLSFTDYDFFDRTELGRPRQLRAHVRPTTRATCTRPA